MKVKALEVNRFRLNVQLISYQLIHRMLSSTVVDVGNL